MNKTKIIAIAAAAVVVIGGACAAAPILRNLSAGAESVTQESTLPVKQEAVTVETTAAIEETTTDVNANAQPQTNADGSIIEKATNAVKKIVEATSSVVGTTKLSSKSDALVDRVMSDENSDSVAFLGYRKSSEGWYYTDDKDCWQSNLGYNETYDKCAPLAAMYIDKVRIRFTYGGYDWMVQFWKGQYGWLLVGAEIGLYTAPAGTYNSGDIGNMNHYDCAGKENWLNMQLDCYWAKNNDGHYEKVFTRPYGKYWWPTGFVKGQLTKYSAPRTELKTKNRITFKDATMATIFVNGLKQSGFVRAASSSQLVDDSYYQSGADVWVLWSSIDHECFAGYEA